MNPFDETPGIHRRIWGPASLFRACDDRVPLTCDVTVVHKVVHLIRNRPDRPEWGSSAWAEYLESLPEVLTDLLEEVNHGD